MKKLTSVSCIRGVVLLSLLRFGIFLGGLSRASWALNNAWYEEFQALFDVPFLILVVVICGVGSALSVREILLSNKPQKVAVLKEWPKYVSALCAGVVLAILFSALQCADLRRSFSSGSVSESWKAAMSSRKDESSSGSALYMPLFEMRDASTRYRLNGAAPAVRATRLFSSEDGNSVEAFPGTELVLSGKPITVTTESPIQRIFIDLPFEGVNTDPTTGITLTSHLTLQMTLRWFVVLLLAFAGTVGMPLFKVILPLARRSLALLRQGRKRLLE